MEATGTFGLDLAAFLHGQGVQVSIVHPARIKAYGSSGLARNKTDQLPAHPSLLGWGPQATPPAAHLRELRELVRRCDALKAARVQELNRQQVRLCLEPPSRPPSLPMSPGSMNRSRPS